MSDADRPCSPLHYSYEDIQMALPDLELSLDLLVKFRDSPRLEMNYLYSALHVVRAMERVLANRERKIWEELRAESDRIEKTLEAA